MEMRILDHAEEVPERIPHGTQLNAPAHVFYFLKRRCALGHEPRERGLGVVTAITDPINAAAQTENFTHHGGHGDFNVRKAERRSATWRKKKQEIPFQLRVFRVLRGESPIS